MSETVSGKGQEKSLTVQEQIDQAVASALDHERKVAAVTNATSVDGRYLEQTAPVREIVSEDGLMRYRAEVEVRWLQTLLKGDVSDYIPPVSDDALAALDEVVEGYSVDDSLRIKEFENGTPNLTATRHDVKAVEYWLREKMQAHPELASRLELAHFGATSEDINNLAYAMMVRDLRGEVFVPRLRKLQGTMADKALEWADIPMLGLTHGQPATPLTLGKSLAVPTARLGKQIDALEGIDITGKFNGATGNYNSLIAADPDVDWRGVTSDFVSSLGFTPNEVTTQIEPLDWFSEFGYRMAQTNNVLKGFDVDTWINIMLRRFTQIPEAGATGSSTMPQKINPIRFENSEGNFDIATAIWERLANRLAYSRLERDLSGSTVMRNLGYVAGLQIVAIDNLQKGLGQIYPNEVHLAEELDANPAVLGEAVQTVMRIHSQYEGAPESYDILKQLTRGKEFSYPQYLEFVAGLDIPQEAKDRLLALTADTYTGAAADIATRVGEGS